jgi:hypothetical protein
VAGRIACKDASLFDAFSGPWTSSSTFYKMRYTTVIRDAQTRQLFASHRVV